MKRSGSGSNVIETVKEIGGILQHYETWWYVTEDHSLVHGNGKLMSL